MSWLELVALTPVLILALGSTAVLMVGAWFPARRPLFGAGVALALWAALWAALVTPPVAEVGAMFGTGPYARFFTVLWSLAGGVTLLSSLRYAEERDFPGGEYVSLILFACAGMALLSSATSLVGLFLGLEAFTLVLYILIAFHKEAAEGAEAGLKYLVLGAVATGFLAFGIALVYTASGTFHLPEAMAGIATGASLRPLGLLGWGMLLVAVGFKVSLVPFHLWTPDVYQGSPAPVAGILSTGSKGAVFASLVTLFAGWSAGREVLEPLLWVLAALSMIVGTLSALGQDNLKRMLAYSSVVHMGFVLAALLAGGGAGRGAVVFYLVAYGAANLGAFAVLASLSGRDEPQGYADLRGQGFRHPLQAGALAVFLLSLAGIPPTAGFIGKFGVFHAALSAGYPGLALLGVLASLVSLYYYLRPVVIMFMSEEEAPALHPGGFAERTALLLCLAATLALGLLPGPLLDMIRLVLP